MGDWGWRIPFFIGCMIVPVLFVIRRSLQETEEFKAPQAPPRHCARSSARCWTTGRW